MGGFLRGFFFLILGSLEVLNLHNFLLVLLNELGLWVVCIFGRLGLADKLPVFVFLLDGEVLLGLNVLGRLGRTAWFGILQATELYIVGVEVVYVDIFE